MFIDDCRLGNEVSVREAISEDRSLAHFRDPATGATGLHFAARSGYSEIAKALIATGADANTRDLEGRTPLIFMADWCTRPDLVNLLISAGGNVNSVNDNGATALSIAAACSHRPGHCWGDFPKLVRSLLSAGAEHDIFSAVIVEDLDEMDRIAAQNPPVVHDTRSFGYFPAGATALHTACDRGSTQAVERLLDHGSNVAARDGRGRPPVYLAAHDAGTRKPGPSPDAVQALLARGVEKDIHAVALLGDLDLLRSMLAADRSLTHARDFGGRTPLHLASWNGQLEAARILINSGAAVDALDLRGDTAYTGGEIGDLLVEHGIRLNIFQAIGRKNTESIRDIVKKDKNALIRTSRYGQSPLRKAAEWSDGKINEVIACLLELGAPMDLWTASALGLLDEAKRILIEDPDSVNRYDNVSTPLHCAVSEGQSEAIDLLLDHGAAIEAITVDLATPLIWAVWKGKSDIARQLAARGANQYAIDNWADNPWVMNELTNSALP